MECDQPSHIRDIIVPSKAEGFQKIKLLVTEIYYYYHYYYYYYYYNCCCCCCCCCCCYYCYCYYLFLEKGFPLVKRGKVIVHLLAPSTHLESGEMFYQVSVSRPFYFDSGKWREGLYLTYRTNHLENLSWTDVHFWAWHIASLEFFVLIHLWAPGSQPKNHILTIPIPLSAGHYGVKL